ncbi:MAG: hypothetical protein ACLU9S_11820 [Oscillospiraceae bacterium]
MFPLPLELDCRVPGGERYVLEHFCLRQRRDAAGEVGMALASEAWMLDEGAVAMIVGRDAGALLTEEGGHQEPQWKPWRENLSDGVVAPLVFALWRGGGERHLTRRSMQHGLQGGLPMRIRYRCFGTGGGPVGRRAHISTATPG